MIKAGMKVEYWSCLEEKWMPATVNVVWSTPGRCKRGAERAAGTVELTVEDGTPEGSDKYVCAGNENYVRAQVGKTRIDPAGGVPRADCNQHHRSVDSSAAAKYCKLQIETVNKLTLSGELQRGEQDLESHPFRLRPVM